MANDIGMPPVLGDAMAPVRCAATLARALSVCNSLRTSFVWVGALSPVLVCCGFHTQRRGSCDIFVSTVAREQSEVPRKGGRGM